MFAVIKIIAQVGLVYFGNSGVYLTTAISGLVDVDAITLSMADMFTSRSIGSTLAIQGILIATIVNTIVKGVIAYTQGEKKFGMKVGLSFGASVIAGIISIVLLAL